MLPPGITISKLERLSWIKKFKEVPGVMHEYRPHIATIGDWLYGYLAVWTQQCRNWPEGVSISSASRLDKD
jgi:hypothetical protein